MNKTQMQVTVTSPYRAPGLVSAKGDSKRICTLQQHADGSNGKVWLAISVLYTVSQKARHQTLAHNFNKC